MMAVVALATGFAFGTDGVWTYTKALDSSKIDWQDATKWQGGKIPNGADDTAALGGVATELGSKIQIINVTNAANRTYSNDEKIGLALRSVTGLKNQQIRQDHGLKSLAEVFDPSGFLGPWSTERVYSGLSVAADADTSVPQLMTGNMFELNLPNAGVKTTVGKVRGVGTMIKKGTGDLAITDAGANATTLRLAGAGTLSLGRDKSNDDHPVAGAWLHLDASQTNTMTFVAGADGKTYVSRWNDCDGAKAYAEQTLAIAESATNRPFLRLDGLNGKPVVDFGAFFGNNIEFDVYDHDVATYGETAWMDVKNQKIPKTAFVVMQEVRADHCDAVPVGNTGSALWYRFNARQDKIRYAGRPFGNDYGQFCWYRDGVSLNGCNVAHDRRMNLTEWTVWAIPYEGNTYFNALMRDRNGRFGGARVAEVIAYETALTEAEIRQNVAYLKNKWLRGVTAEGEDIDLGAAIVEDAGVKFEVGAGRSAKIALVENKAGATFVKTGAGDLAVENVGASKPVDFDIQGGTVRLENVSPDAEVNPAPAANPSVWLSADADASRFTFVEENGTNFVAKWGDVRADQTTEYAYNDGEKFGGSKGKLYRRPWLDTVNTLNGKPVMNFGPWITGDGVDADGRLGAALRFVNGSFETREAFLMFADVGTGHAAWILGSAVTGPAFCRSIQSGRQRIVAEEYVDGFVSGGRWHVDGHLINPMDYSLPSDAFELIDFSLEQPARAEFLGTDRPTSQNRSGGIKLAEVIFYDRELTDKERRDTQAYLLKKWKNLNHPDDETVKVGSVTGSGTLEVARAIEPALGEVAVNRFVSSADLRFDASDVTTMTLDGAKVLEWRDANGSGKKLVATSTAYTPNRPKLITATINEVQKNAVTLSGLTKSTAAAGGKSKLAATAGNGTSFDLCTADGKLTSGSYRHFFVVMADCNDNCTEKYDHRAALVDSTYGANPVFYRDTGNNGQLIRNTYAVAEAYTSSYWKNGSVLDFEWKDKVAKSKSAEIKVTDFNYHVYAIAASTEVKIDHVGVWLDNSNYCYYGGKNICEMICFANELTADEIAEVNAYLRDKWQAVPVSYSAEMPSNMELLKGGCISVGAKTTLALADNVPCVGKIVAKTVESASAMSFDFTSRTTCERLEVEGEFALGASGTITVGGDFKPQYGEYPLVVATSVSGVANLANWSVVNATESRCPMSLKVVGNTLYLVVERRGSMVIVR